MKLECGIKCSISELEGGGQVLMYTCKLKYGETPWGG